MSDTALADTAAPAPADSDSGSITTPDAQPSQETSGGDGGGFWSRLFGSGRQPQTSSPAREASENDQPSGATDESEVGEGAASAAGDADSSPQAAQAAQAARAAEGAPAAAPKAAKREVSEEELYRLVQSEVDKREAKRQRDEERRLREDASRVQDARLRQLDVEEEQADQAYDLDRGREIRQERKQILGQIRQHQFVAQTITAFDAHTLVPLLEPLPQADQERIVAALLDMEPLPGRAHAVKEALSTLEKQWRHDEAAKVRQRLKADESFLREVRARWRDEEDEPEHIAGAASNGRTDPNAALAALIRGH